jgi:hypothetical protein
MLTLSEASFRCKRLLRIRHWRERRWERYLDPELRAEVRVSAGGFRGLPVAFFSGFFGKDFSLPKGTLHAYTCMRKAGDSDPSARTLSGSNSESGTHTGSAFQHGGPGPLGPSLLLPPLDQDPCGLQPGAWTSHHHPSWSLSSMSESTMSALGSSPTKSRSSGCSSCLEGILPLAVARVLRRLRQWDHLDTAGDGLYWKREIDAALAALPEHLRRQVGQ